MQPNLSEYARLSIFDSVRGLIEMSGTWVKDLQLFSYKI